MDEMKLLSRIRKVFVSAIGRTGLLHETERYRRERHEEDCARKTRSTSVTFGPNSRVHNYANDRNKITVGEGSRIEGELLVYPSCGTISLGIGCFLGENSRIWSTNEVRIGNHVLISHNAAIMDSNSHEFDYRVRAESGYKMLTEGFAETLGDIADAPVYIEDHVWIGIGSIVLKGVRIGEGSIVAAGSVVTHDVPPFVLVAGNPARHVRSVMPQGGLEING